MAKDSKGNDIFVPQYQRLSLCDGRRRNGKFPARSETVAGLSSGGFSNRWKRPSWQKDATAKYLPLREPAPPQAFQRYGQGFPDIARAVDFIIVQFGILPLVFQERLARARPPPACSPSQRYSQQNKSSLGFLNPFIYSNMGSFNDVVTINNGWLYARLPCSSRLGRCDRCWDTEFQETFCGHEPAPLMRIFVGVRGFEKYIDGLLGN